MTVRSRAKGAQMKKGTEINETLQKRLLMLAEMALVVNALQKAYEMGYTTVTSAPRVFGAGLVSGVMNGAASPASYIDSALNEIEKGNPSVFAELNKVTEGHKAKLRAAAEALRRGEGVDNSFLELPKMNSQAVVRMIASKLNDDGNSLTTKQVDEFAANVLGVAGVADNLAFNLGKFIGEITRSGVHKLSSTVNLEASSKLASVASSTLSLVDAVIPVMLAEVYAYTNLTKAVAKVSFMPMQATTLGLAGFAGGLYDAISGKDTNTQAVINTLSKMTWREIATSVPSAVYAAGSQVITDVSKAYNISVTKKQKASRVLETGDTGDLLKQKPHKAGKVGEVLLKEAALSSQTRYTVNFTDSVVASVVAIGAVASKYTYKAATVAGELAGKAYKDNVAHEESVDVKENKKVLNTATPNNKGKRHAARERARQRKNINKGERNEITR